MMISTENSMGLVFSMLDRISKEEEEVLFYFVEPCPLESILLDMAKE